jgi:hypothetical protein
MTTPAASITLPLPLLTRTACASARKQSKRLQAKNVKFRESIVPRTGGTQFFLYDPDGVGVELNFPSHKPSSLPVSVRPPGQ